MVRTYVKFFYNEKLIKRIQIKMFYFLFVVMEYLKLCTRFESGQFNMINVLENPWLSASLTFLTPFTRITLTTFALEVFGVFWHTKTTLITGVLLTRVRDYKDKTKSINTYHAQCVNQMKRYGIATFRC